MRKLQQMEQYQKMLLKFKATEQVRLWSVVTDAQNCLVIYNQHGALSLSF
jgi:hypothetical protein